MSIDTSVPTYTRVPATCWGNTEHTLSAVCLSACKQGCLVYVCTYCKKRYVLHNPMYGCRLR